MTKISEKKILDQLKELKDSYETQSFFDPDAKLLDSIFFEDKEYFKLALCASDDAMKYAPEQFKGDKDIAELAASRNYLNLEHVSNELKADKEFMEKIISKEGFALRFLPKELLLDQEYLSQFRDHEVA